MSFISKIRHHLLWRRHVAKVSDLHYRHPLKYLFLEVTRRCNLACLYCGSGCTGRAPEGEMAIPEWIDFIREVAADFRPRDVMVAVTGGEPLLKEGIFDLFQELRKLGFRYGMVSNSLLLDADAARRLVDAGIGSISLSMDALPEINDQMRGRGCSEKVQHAVRNLKAAGYRGKLEIISTVTKPAVPGLDDMRRFVAGMQVPLWRAAPVMPIGRAAERLDLVPDARDVRIMLEYMRVARRDGMLPRPEFSEEGFLGFRFEGVVRPYLCQCRAGITVGGIRYDGRIGACPELTDAFDQGSIRKDRFHKVWDQGYDLFRDRSWTKKDECADCRHYEICRGGSLHLYADPKSKILRCLYNMCKETDSMPVAQPPAQAAFYR